MNALPAFAAFVASLLFLWGGGISKDWGMVSIEENLG